MLKNDPIVGKFLGAEDEDCPVAQLVIFDDGQSSKCLAEPNTVGKNAPVVCLKLVDDAGGSILLEVIELLPDDSVLVAGAFVWQYIFAHVLQELAEDAVEHQEIDSLR